MVETGLGFCDYFLTIVIGYHYVDNDIALGGAMVHEENIVGKIQFVVRVVEDVTFIRGKLFELVDEVIAKCAEESAGDAERFAGKLK